MERPILLSKQFRHVVFPGAAGGRRKVLNLGDPCPLRVETPAAEPSLSQENAAFLQWLFRQAGLNVRAYRVETLRRRLPACLRALQARSPAHARRLLEEDPALVPTALDTMLIGVTSFFRDPAVFNALRDEVVPALAAGRAGLYVWSAACSDGAELYSVAILLAELGLLNRSCLLGSDCRPRAVGRAREGWFDPDAVRGVPAGLLARYFTPRDGGWQLVPALRRAAHWRTGNVLTMPEPGVWDLVLFRNASMYLRAEAAGPLWERFEAALRAGGVLVLGRAERPLGSRRLSLLKPCIYRRIRG
jgi:chemotaxis methyl-accepting protein methylase